MDEPVKLPDEILLKTIESEMKKAYLDYSMSVIAGRALPDARDGLKPVHRRVLYTMLEIGLIPNRSFKKSATIVGNVMAKYHPHGDQSIYDALVRMAQTFSLRYPLVNGQGNFGSIDGDNAAAMRYTEAKLMKAGHLLLEDIDKNTVDFVENFDGSAKEPCVLPGKLPNLLLNGASGIAVGMATNIPPHNAAEVISAAIALIRDPELSSRDLMAYIPGPDFPTGGEIVNSAALMEGYETGRSALRVRSKWHYESHDNREWLVITQIPYQVNKSALIEEIAEAVKVESVLGIHDLRDESDKEGLRIVIEMKRDASRELLENQLLKHTRIETTFGMMLIAIDKGQPKTFSLKDLLASYISHRFEVITRRTAYELERARERMHIIEGLIIALDHIDEVIATIKSSKSGAIAKDALMSGYELSDRQAQAILEMRLQKLAATEMQQIRDEHAELERMITRFERILADHQAIFKIMIDELEQVRGDVSGDRITDLTNKVIASIDEESLIAQETVVVTITDKGYVKRLPLDEYRSQKRGGRGLTAASTTDDDHVTRTIVCSTHDYLMLFSNLGKCYWLKTWRIPQAGRAAKGRPLVNFVELAQDERISAYIPVRTFDEGFLFFITRKGVVKRVPLNAFSNVRSVGIRAMNLEDDELVDVKFTDGSDEILIATMNGMSVRFKEDDVRAMGRTAYGVRGIRLRENDAVIGAAQRSEGPHVLTIKSDGLGKRTQFDAYRLQSRGGSGIINIRTQGSHVVGIRAVDDEKGIIVVTRDGVLIRTFVKNISIVGRATKGVRIIRLDEGDTVSSFTTLPSQEVDENGTDENNDSA